MALWLLLSCAGWQREPLLADNEPGEELSGGGGTVFDTSENAYALSIRGLDREQRRAFAVGNSFFNDNWVTAPASAEGRDGLGPLFNARSCSGCHFKDGRGRPPAEGEEMLSMLLRISIGQGPGGAPLPDPGYGGQIQDKAVAGAEPEAVVGTVWEETQGAFPDGEPYSLHKPVFTLSSPAYGAFSEDLRIGPRVAPGVYGMGLLEAVDAETVLAAADPDDGDGDGISGRPNMVPDGGGGAPQLGRFGWKAGVPTVKAQVAGAFLGDIGITSPLHPDHGHTGRQAALDGLPNGGEPEVDESKLDRITLYCQLLAVPARRAWMDGEVRRGKLLFREAGCASCHLERMETGESHPVELLRNQTIHPYTDMLLHDMGEGLADGMAVYEASGSEWRTPPLWGIGLVETVNGHTRFLHDGRARNLQEAILWHGGEALPSREAYAALPPEDRKAVLAFLGSL